jgi:ubiquinone/menaquinone biosynthesis C-methylase UbiE
VYSDYYTNELLHYLTPPGSPSFHDFGRNPPRDVLDLGCGEGYWAAEAASAWKAAGTIVTAFDIVDLGRPLRKTLDSEIAQRIIWVKGNLYVLI